MKTNRWMIGLAAAALVGCACASEGEEEVIVIGPDGPSLVQARDRIRAERRAGAKGPRTVRLKPGTYNLTETFALGPEDSSVTYVADGDVTVTGSRPLGAWTVEQDGSWSVRVDWVRPDRTGGFRMLRVGGGPRPRARLPKAGYYEVVNDDLPPKTPYNAPRPCCFLKPEEFHFDWPHIEDLEMIVYHFWTDSHLRIASMDPASNKVTFVAACGKAFDTGWSNNKSGGLRGIYVLENFPAAMTEPGEWWLDHAGQTLHYLPKPGEDPRTARAEVPYVRTLVSIAGEPEKDGRFAEDIVFRGVRFTLAQYELAPNDTNGSQASAKVAAAVRLAGARRCRFEECRFEDLSGYAADLLRGTLDCAFAHCMMTRLGAGGVRLNGGGVGCHPYARASGNAIEDCEIGPYGTDFRSAVGVLLMNAEKTKIRHNHIFDGWYTGISAGWVWGYGESASHHNEISHNHIHKIGQGCLSDMGGIYMLGPSCGTVVSHNRIHDVDARSYGGWGIYNDEGSSDILIENNVVYDTKFAGYDIHYAKDLTVRNNIFAFGRMDQLARTRRERHVSCTLLNNIVYWTGGRLFSGDWSDAAEPFPVLKPQRNGNAKPQMSTVTFNADANVYFNPNAAVTNVVFGNGLTFGSWRKAGKDRRSVYADPLFVDPAARDFRLKPGSPAYRLGFVDFDQNDVGPRRSGAKVVEVSSVAELFAVRDGFRRMKPAEPVEVRLKPGTYLLTKTFELTAKDSGSESAPISYVSEPGANRAVLTAARRVPTGRFVPWKDGILVADIADLGVRLPSRREIETVTQMPVPVPEVFVDGERFVTADWPNAGEWATFTNFVVRGAGWEVKSPTNRYGKAWSNGVFGYDGDRPARWTGAPYLWVHGYFCWDWRDNVLWMSKIDPVKKTIALGHRATYGLAPGNPSPRRWRAVHLLEELDRPGEYYVDFAAKRLYLKPKRPFAAETRVEITAGADLLLKLSDVRHVSFGNLILRAANRGVEGKGCSRVTFERVRIENIRGAGARLEDSDHVLVRTCDFIGIGSSCLSLSGGDRRTLVSAQNRVTDCDFGPAGVLSKTGCAGFCTQGVGTVFDHNFVHDMPHHALGVSHLGGNDCVFAYNVISNCCNESDDAAAFYKGRNPSSCGNVLDHNVFVDCGQNGKHGTMAVYFDDGDCGETVRDNLFVRCGNKPYKNAKFTHGAIFYNGGYAFTTEGNVFIDCPAGCRTSGADGWATDAWWRDHLKKLEKRLVEDVCVTGAVYRAHYPWIATLLPGLPDGRRTNEMRRCTFVNVKAPASGRTHCSPDCRFLDRDDGTRPDGIEKAGLVTVRPH